MPDRVTFPFIQCHHTRGCAVCGGDSKPERRATPEDIDVPASGCPALQTCTPVSNVMSTHPKIDPRLGVPATATRPRGWSPRICIRSDDPALLSTSNWKYVT